MNLPIVRHLPFCFLVMIVFTALGCQNAPETSLSVAGKNNAPLNPQEALTSFELETGFKIELLAAEPLIADPVDMEIDENGRLYVVEMHGYPLDKSGTGVIKILTDTDGDGRMDKSTVFADGLVLPNSIMRWKKGILITDAPHVLYFEDTNGDGKADVRDTMLTGFALSNPQHNLNSPVLGMDNWIYLAHEGAVATQNYKKEFGDEGSEIYYPGWPGSPRLAKNASGRSVRFRPDQHLLETTSSNTQFGHTFDEWGHHFLVTNWNHSIQEVMAASYLKRNPALLVANATQSLSDHSDAAEVFPVTKNPEHQLLTDVGVITSACGITRYLGGSFPAPFEKAIFVAEPVSNLVHVDLLTDKGASFVASRMHPHQEFLASTDAWFRPVNMYIGPDGALYVVDYYRQIIEHPEWMGEEVVKSGQLYNGHDRGRIYRISPATAPAADWTKGLKLGEASNEQLVSYLAHPNSWWRMNAQRLLVDRKDKSVVPALAKMVQNPMAPLGQVHALWTLEGMSQLTPEWIEQALKGETPGVRQNAIQLAELHLDKAPSLSLALLPLQNDTDAKVRFQLLCTLGAVSSPEALEARNHLLFRDLADEWVQVAALSGAADQTASLLNKVLYQYRPEVSAYASLVQRLSAMIGAHEKPALIHQLVQKAIATDGATWQAPLLEGLAQGWKNRATLKETSADEAALVQLFFKTPYPPVRRATLNLLKATGIRDGILKKEALAKAATLAADKSQPVEKREAAIRFLSLDNKTSYSGLLKDLITPEEPASIQMAALQTLSTQPGTTAPQYLLSRWTSLTPEVQDAAMNTFLKDTAAIALLLNALEKGEVQPASIGWHRSVSLMAQPNAMLRDKARRLLTKGEEDRAKVTQAYQPVFSLKGDAEKGKAVYLQNCSSCHQIRGTLGVSFGPDLGTIHNWSAEAIMANILAPDLSISSGFDLWNVQLKNGTSMQGIIASETATSLTLKNAAREERTINRADIQTLRPLNMSAMPAGLEKQISQQEMADLLAFLKQNK